MAVGAKEVAATLVVRRQREREADARRAEEVRAATLELVGSGLARMPGTRAWLIGSIAWGGFGLRSDVDVVVEGLTSEEATELELALLARLELPVDLLRLEELPEGFRARVLADGVACRA